MFCVLAACLPRTWRRRLLVGDKGVGDCCVPCWICLWWLGWLAVGVCLGSIRGHTAISKSRSAFYFIPLPRVFPGNSKLLDTYFCRVTERKQRKLHTLLSVGWGASFPDGWENGGTRPPLLTNSLPAWRTLWIQVSWKKDRSVVETHELQARRFCSWAGERREVAQSNPGCRPHRGLNIDLWTWWWLASPF